MDGELDLDTLNELTDEQILDAGLAAIEHSLGPLGMIRFMQIVRPGTGNYTEERHAWLDHLTLDDWLSPTEGAAESATPRSDSRRAAS